MMESRTANIETEDALRLFTDTERRRVVEELVDRPENTVSVQELADLVAQGPSPGGSPPRPNRSLVSLKHHHLPRLEDIGIIQYDCRSDTVRYHPDVRIERLLEFIRTELE